MMLASNTYATFVVGFAIMTDSMIYTLVLPFLPDLFAGRLHVPESKISQWNALAFEVFAVATLLSNLVVSFFADASASKSKPFLLSVVIMVTSTVIFFIATTPEMILISRAIQGASTTFTWVTGLAYLVAKVGEGELGAYVGWTTVGVAVGEIIGPLVGGPIYDYFGHWAAFAVVEALLLVDILLRVLAKDNKKPEIDTEAPVEENMNAGSADQNLETNALLEAGGAGSTDYNTVMATETDSHRSVMSRLAWNWLGTMFTLVVIFVVRGALEVAVPLYLTRQYSWTPAKISLALLTITVPAAVNPVVGELTSRQGPRWWSTGTFAICGAAFISFGNVAGNSEESKTLFIVHSIVIGISLAVLVNSNQVAISVAAQRYGFARTRAEDKNEELGAVLSWISPSTMLSGVTTSWAAGILLGPAYSNLMAYTEDAGWEIFCRGLGGLCLVAAVGSSFLWRTW